MIYKTCETFHTKRGKNVRTKTKQKKMIVMIADDDDDVAWYWCVAACCCAVYKGYLG